MIKPEAGGGGARSPWARRRVGCLDMWGCSSPSYLPGLLGRTGIPQTGVQDSLSSNEQHIGAWHLLLASQMGLSFASPGTSS